MSSQADQEAKQEAQTPAQPAKLGSPGLVYFIGAIVAGCFGAAIGTPSLVNRWPCWASRILAR